MCELAALTWRVVLPTQKRKCTSTSLSDRRDRRARRESGAQKRKNNGRELIYCQFAVRRVFLLSENGTSASLGWMLVNYDT